MSSQAKVSYTPEEYLALERQAEYKSEYFNGEIFAMTGASHRYNLTQHQLYLFQLLPQFFG
jgi:Uma2 family endonuclease